MESAEQPTKDLHTRVKQSLKQMGHAAADVNPADDLSLENIRDILGKTTVHIVNSVESEGPLTRVETATGPKVIPFVEERKRKLEKAA